MLLFKMIKNIKYIRGLPDCQSFQEKLIMLVMKGAIFLLAPPGEKVRPPPAGTFEDFKVGEAQVGRVTMSQKWALFEEVWVGEHMPLLHPCIQRR